MIYQHLKNNFLANSADDENISRDDFHKICGIIEVNSLDVPFDIVELSAVYPTFSMLEHNCTPNIKISFNKFNVIVRSAAAIKK